MATGREFSVAARLRSFRHAGRGLWTLLSTQHNAWIHALASVLAVVLGLRLGVSRQEWLALVLALAAVWTVEALNTALEFACDAASTTFHPLIEKAKDVAAAAVLLSALGALVVGALVFVPYLLPP